MVCCLESLCLVMNILQKQEMFGNGFVAIGRKIFFTIKPLRIIQVNKGMKKILLICCICFSAAIVKAQFSLQTRVCDTSNGEMLEMVTVRLLRNDSSLVSGAQTDQKGFVQLGHLKNGEYILAISSVGYEPYFKNIRIDGKNLILKTIPLKELSIKLNDVEIRGTAAQMLVKGDTLEYNATAFKTAENAVAEELLKKMPGVEVSSEGTITVNGEEVKRILVDGKKFFDDDVQMATKNIPAEMIDKVQVLDDKSEMAKLTGFEDDETERVINLTLKPNRKKGYFGNFTGGYGLDVNLDSRYSANAFMNLMLDETQTTIIGGANNTNEFRSGRGRGNINAGSGITRTENFGVNSNATLKNDMLLGGDVSFNHSNNNALNEVRKESYLTDGSFINHDKKTSLSDNYETRGRFEMEWQIDDANKLIIRPEISYSNQQYNKTNEYTYLTGSDTTSYGHTNNFNTTEEIGAKLHTTFNHKFSKPGRTLTMRFNIDFDNKDADGINQSENNALSTQEYTLINQQTLNTSNTLNYDVRLSYVEPLYRNRHFLEFVASFKNNLRFSEKRQYSIDSAGNYTLFDSVYSNNYQSNFMSETMEVNYRLQDAKYSLMLGVKVNPSQTLSETLYGDGYSHYINSYVWNVAPTLNFRYKFDKKEFIRIDYRGNTTQPSITQMEPSKNNTDIMNEQVGNPSLKPAFRQNFRFMYSKYNSNRFSSVTTGLYGTFVQDALVINSIYDETGKQYRQTVNAEAMPFTLMGHVMYNTPLIEKRLHFNTRTALSHNRNIAYTSKNVSLESIDLSNLCLGDLSKTDNFKAEEQLSLTFTHDVVEIGIRGNVIYSRTQNNLTTSISNLLDWNATGSLTLHLPYQFTISSDIGYTARYGYNLDNPNELIWNASIDKTLFRNQATLSLKAYDMLNQRKNIRQVVDGNSISYETYNTLPTYVMLSFTYKLNKMGNIQGGGMPPQRGRRPPRPF